MSTRNAVFRTALEALYFSGAHMLAAPFAGGAGLIFTLHHVRPAREGAFQPNRILEVTPDFLEEAIERVRLSGIDIVSIDEGRRRLIEGGRRFACFTFDDGYRDNLVHALPILERHEVPFAMYVASSFADGTGDLWWVALERAIAARTEVVFETAMGREILPCASDEDKNLAFARIYWALRGLKNEAELRRVVSTIAGAAGLDTGAICRELCMGWDELGRIARHPLMTLGAHTVEHVMLATWPEARARREMAESRDAIEGRLGVRPRHFCYPVGDPTSAGAREFALAAELGFETAVTTRPGVLHADHAGHLTALPRVSLNGAFQKARYVDVFLSGAPFVLYNGFRRVAA